MKKTPTVDSPPCRCGNPSTRWVDDKPTCDSCYHKEGHDMSTELAPVDPLTMAIQRGIDADGLAKIVGLIRERERDEAEKAFSEAVRSVSELAAPIVKSKQGNKSRYAPLEEVNRAMVPLYTTAGLSLTFSEADCPFADKGWKRHVCDVRHVKGHKERYHLDVPLDNADGKNPGMNPIQSAISTGSYVQRVLLCRIFNVTIADSDVDGQSLSDLLFITPEQASDIKDLIVQNEMDEAALLKWLKAESVEKVTRAAYEKFQTTYRQRKAVKS